MAYGAFRVQGMGLSGFLAFVFFADGFLAQCRVHPPHVQPEHTSV